MKQFTSHEKLYWSLVGLGAAAIFAVWIPHMAHQFSLLGVAVANAEKSTALERTKASLDQISRSWGTLQASIKDPKVYGATHLDEGQLDTLVKEVKQHADSVNTLPSLPQPKSVEVPAVKDSDPSRAFCTRNGGQYEQRQRGHLKYGVCKFTDASECLSLQYMQGECAPSITAVAEDLIQKKADLTVTVEKTGYCKSGSNPVVWLDSAANADAICFQNIVVHNMGWLSSPATSVTMAGHEYPVPALSPATEHSLDSATFRLLTPDMVASAVVDKKNLIKELSEDNNRVSFPLQK